MAMGMGALVMPSAIDPDKLAVTAVHDAGSAFPRLGEGIVRSGGDTNSLPAEGRPALQARVGWQGRVDLLDEFLEPGWTLITRHPLSQAGLNEEQQALIDDLSVQVAHVSRAAGTEHFMDIDGDYDIWFQATGQRAFLVRPDHYVFGAAESMKDIPALLDSLKQKLSNHGWAFGRDREMSR